jgi:hypothetical protein
VNFYDGYVHYYYGKSSSLYVRAVRTKEEIMSETVENPVGEVRGLISQLEHEIETMNERVERLIVMLEPVTDTVTANPEEQLKGVQSNCALSLSIVLCIDSTKEISRKLQDQIKRILL